MKRILLTGATGLLGSEILRIIPDSLQVYSVARNPEALLERAHIIPIQLDFGSDWSYDQLPRDIDAIIHLAQSEHFREFPHRAESVFEVNTQSTLKLLDFGRSAGIKNFVYASSGGIYGPSDEHLSEESGIQLNADLGFYLSTKFCSEVLIENYLKFFHIAVLRFFFIYGPQQKRGMLIPRLIDSISQGNEVTLQGENGIRINPIYVEDAAQATIAAASLPQSHKFNIAGPDTLDFRGLCEIIGKAVNVQPKFKLLAGEQPKHLMADITKMKRFLYTPTTSIDVGIDRMLTERKT